MHVNAAVQYQINVHMHVKKENKNVCRYEQSIVVMAAIGAWREKYNQNI